MKAMNVTAEVISKLIADSIKVSQKRILALWVSFLKSLELLS
jgi:plasmid maintenance system antidote protein VapI